MREHQQFGNVTKCNVRVIIVWYVWTPYDPVIASWTVVTGLLHMKQQLTAENFIRISSHYSSRYIGNNCHYEVCPAMEIWISYSREYNQPTHHMKPNTNKPNPNEQNQPQNNSHKQPPALVNGYIINLRQKSV